MNGEGSVHIDRGRWLYRFALDSGNIAIYRCRRTGQDLVAPEVWRTLAPMGICDAFVIPVRGGWQSFIEVSEGRARWGLSNRPTLEEAQQEAGHFLVTMAEAVAHASALKAGADGGPRPPRLPAPPAAPEEDPAVEDLLALERAERDASGWDLLFSRQRVPR